MTHWVEQRIRLTARRGFCAWLAVLGIVGLSYLANAKYFMDFAAGAFVADGDDLDAIRNIDGAPHQWLRVTGERALDTGVQEVEVSQNDSHETHRRITARYYALAVGDKFLVVRSAGAMPVTAEGGLAVVPADFSKNFFADPEMA